MRLTLLQARRLAVMGQQLDADRPVDLVELVRRLGGLNIDPTAVVARSEHLVAWSRLGDAFVVDDLKRALEVDRTLFQYRSRFHAASDYPMLRPAMDDWPSHSGWRRPVDAWLDANAAFRAYVLDSLRERGPLRAKDLEDRAVQPWRSSGWTQGRNVSQMLEFLAARGEVAISRREGNLRLFDLAERVLPVHLPALDPLDAALARAERRLRAMGVARARDVEGLGEPVTIEGLRGDWVADPELIDQPFAGRTAIVSPFDDLVFDRRRLRLLFDLEYILEIYVPAARRRWGFYVLPVLHGDRFVARFDARVDRVAGVLRILRWIPEPDATDHDLAAAEREVEALARWLGLGGVAREADGSAAHGGTVSRG